MSTQTAGKATEAIQAVVDSWFESVGACDFDRIMPHYTKDVRGFDAILSLQFKGREAYGEHWKKCLESCMEGMSFKMLQPELTGGAGAAFFTCLVECGGRDKNGKKQSGLLRVTLGLKETPAGWKVAHDHWSAPFDPETGKVLGELQP